MTRQTNTINQDWLVTSDGQCQPRPSSREWDLIRDRYYLHQFLSEIVDMLNSVSDPADEWDYLPQIRMRVRQLITNSYWVRSQFADPDPKTGVAILTLYDEIGYPLTVQTVITNPGVCSPIHNHGTWGVIAVLQGREEHTFWRCTGDLDSPDRIELVGLKTLCPTEIISFVPDAIHRVKAIGNEPVVAFHLYGDTQPRSRFEFNPATHTAKPF
ncbi:cupin [Oscillatoria sp. FACHB-1407]|uniref:cysteine dioxygenase family protein n=1 Tax=Oscillatoria sp. FACHB-1407 TaxID=2692847 RepID=UPI001684A5CB|nr:cupin [Oscillatoria sp. FACHB-1407]MBD2459907.1 cupin [Oscillatoria sp. FACHB-1407]